MDENTSTTQGSGDNPFAAGREQNMRRDEQRERSQANGSGNILRLTQVSEIESQAVDWLWVDVSNRHDPMSMDDFGIMPPGQTWTLPEVEDDGRVPCGVLSLAAGREGTGKSSLGIWLTARITTGTLPGMYYGTARRVIYAASEDSWRKTLKPRLSAAGADLRLVYRVEAVSQEYGTETTVSLPADVDTLGTHITAYRAVLLVLDPLMSHLGTGLNANHNQDVRAALEPVKAMAERTGVAVLGIAHFNKATGIDALSRILGSTAFKDVARAGLVFVRRRNGSRVFGQPKNNLGRDDLPSLEYAIERTVVPTDDGRLTSVGRFLFTGLSDVTPEEAMAEEHRAARRADRPLSPVQQFVLDYITEHADENGDVLAPDVIAAGAERGFTERQIIDARSALRDRIGTRRETFQGPSIWRRIEQPPDRRVGGLGVG